MKVVVTGASGLTGGAVVRELVRRGHDVTGTTRSADSLAGIASLGARTAVADPADPRSFSSVLSTADGLVHVAGILLGERVALAGIERVERVVVVSTASIYSRAHGSAELYRRNEDAVRTVAPQATFVRPTMIYGSPRDRNVHRVIAFARRWRVLPLPDGGRARIQPIHYEDLAVATAALLDSGTSGTVDAGGPAPLTLASAARTILAALRLRGLLLPVPVSIAWPAARALDRVAGSRWSERLARTREDRVVDNARLLALTGVPLRSFESGVRDEVAEMTA